jgi:hypothetical protein
VARDLPHAWKGIEGIPVLQEAGVTIDGGGYVRVPYRWPSGDLHVTRVCAPDGRCWWSPAGRSVVPLGLESLCTGPAAHTRGLFIAEGESDTFALRAAYGGTTPGDPVTGIEVIGLPGARTWCSSWRSYVEQYPLIYVVGDGDDAGREMNAVIKRDVPWARTVWLPDGADARSILAAGGPRALDTYLRAADEYAHGWASFILARDLATYERLILDGPEVPGLA